MAFYSNPGDQAESTLNQIPSTISPYYQPYINAGNQSLGILQNQYGNLLGNYSSIQQALTNMLTNPAGDINALGSQYQQSPGYQWELSQGEAAAENAASAGGYAGTPADQQFQMQTAEGLANQDYYKWLQTVLGVGKTGLKGEGQLYGAGLRGEQGLNQMGYNASNQLAEGLAQYLSHLASLQYSSQVNQNEHNMGLLGDTLGFVSNLIRPRSGNSDKSGSDVATASDLAWLGL